MHDMREFYQVELGQANQLNATASTSGVDISDYIGTLKVILSAENVSGTDATLATKIQDSADNSTFADVTGGAFTVLTDEDGFEALHLDTRALNQYIRVLDTLGGTDPVYNRSVTLVGRKQVGGQG